MGSCAEAACADVMVVGLLGFEPRTKGFTLTGRFPIRVDYLFTLPASNYAGMGCGTL